MRAKIYNQWNNISQPSTAGSSIVTVYERNVEVETGRVEAVKVSQYDLYEEIQAANEDSMIKDIILKHSQGKQIDLPLVDILDPEGYVDLTVFPQEYIELTNYFKRTEKVNKKVTEYVEAALQAAREQQQKETKQKGEKINDNK